MLLLSPFRVYIAHYILQQSITNMKKIILFCSLLAAQQALFAQGMTFFEGSWEEAQAAAKTQNKPIFVDAYATWCGPCKRMAADVFPQKEVGDFMNKHFINYKLDVEKGDGIPFSETYGVQLLPTLYFFNPNGELSHKVVGGLATKDFLQASQNALDPDKQLYTQKQKYDKGARDKAFVQTYLNNLLDASEAELAQPVLKTYWDLLDDKERQSEAAFLLLVNAVSDHNSPIFAYFLQNQKAYEVVVTAPRVNSYLDRVLQNAANQAANPENITNPKKELPAAAKKLHHIMPNKKDYIDHLVTYSYYAQLESDSKEALNVYHTHYMKYATHWQQLNAAAWFVVEQRDAKQYKRALQWIDRSISMDRNFYNLDTKAWLLHLSKKNKEALATAEEAVKLAQATDNDASATLELIELIKAAK